MLSPSLCRHLQYQLVVNRPNASKERDRIAPGLSQALQQPSLSGGRGGPFLTVPAWRVRDGPADPVFQFLDQAVDPLLQFALGAHDHPCGPAFCCARIWARSGLRISTSWARFAVKAPSGRSFSARSLRPARSPPRTQRHRMQCRERVDHKKNSNEQTRRHSNPHATSQDFGPRSRQKFIHLTQRCCSARRAPPATLDFLVRRPYFASMISRLVTLLAICAITLVTTFASAHAARMSSSAGADPESPVAGMVHSSQIAERSCDAGQPCGAADAGICEFVCAGLSAFLTSRSGETGHAYGPASHDFPSVARHVSRAPGLTERPPKLRLL